MLCTLKYPHVIRIVECKKRKSTKTLFYYTLVIIYKLIYNYVTIPSQILMNLKSKVVFSFRFFNIELKCAVLLGDRKERKYKIRSNSLYIKVFSLFENCCNM